MCDSLEAEVTGLLCLFHLVKLQKAGRGAEDARVALPLINSLSVDQGHFAVGARRGKLHVGHSGCCRRERRKHGVFHQGEEWISLILHLQVLLLKTKYWFSAVSTVPFISILNKSLCEAKGIFFTGNLTLNSGANLKKLGYLCLTWLLCHRLPLLHYISQGNALFHPRHLTTAVTLRVFLKVKYDILNINIAANQYWLCRHIVE